MNLVKINDRTSSELNLSALFKKYFNNFDDKSDIRYVAFDFLALYNQSSDLLLHETKKMAKQILKELGIFFYESYIPTIDKQTPSIAHIKSQQKGIVRFTKFYLIL